MPVDQTHQRELLAALHLRVPPAGNALVPAEELTAGMVVRIPNRFRRARSSADPPLRFYLKCVAKVTEPEEVVLPFCRTCGKRLHRVGPNWSHADKTITHPPLPRHPGNNRWVFIHWQTGRGVPVEADRLIEVVCQPDPPTRSRAGSPAEKKARQNKYGYRWDHLPFEPLGAELLARAHRRECGWLGSDHRPTPGICPIGIFLGGQNSADLRSYQRARNQGSFTLQAAEKLLEKHCPDVHPRHLWGDTYDEVAERVALRQQTTQVA